MYRFSSIIFALEVTFLYLAHQHEIRREEHWQTLQGRLVLVFLFAALVLDGHVSPLLMIATVLFEFGREREWERDGLNSISTILLLLLPSCVGESPVL